jgi:HPr kinase/phosphorylase
MSEPRDAHAAVTVEDFLRAGKGRLALDLAAGSAGLKRRVEEAAINRPGLALTGFFEYFAHRRVQVLGNAEISYLMAQSEADRRARLRRVFEHHVPCVVVTRRHRVLAELQDLAEEFRTPVLRTPMITKHFINAATLVMEELMAPRIVWQGTTVEILGIGVLLEGKAGVGKSETALALLQKGHSLVADDVTELRVDQSGAVIASAVGITRYHMEIRGLGIIHVPSLFGVASVRSEKRLDLVVTLSRDEGAGEGDRSGQDNSTREILGVPVPHLALPVAPGRDMANLVEVAALDLKLKRLGHDAAKELDEKLIAVLAGGAESRE